MANKQLRAWLSRALVVAGTACVVVYGAANVDTWRYQQYAKAAVERTVPPLVLKRGDLIGRIEIPRLKISAAVAEGDDDETLKKAIGHLPETPLPWQFRGNVAIAAHRDGLFRRLEGIKLNDEIRVVTPRGDYSYRVSKTHIVNPNDLWVVAHTDVPTLTLITCYPFSFVGNAPQRFVVQAEMPGHRAGRVLKGKVVQDKGR